MINKTLENKILKENLDLSNNNLKTIDYSSKINVEQDKVKNIYEMKENDINLLINSMAQKINSKTFEKSLINIIQSNNISIEAKFKEFKNFFNEFSKFIINNIFSKVKNEEDSFNKNIEINEFFLTDMKDDNNCSKTKLNDLNKTINYKTNDMNLNTNNPEKKYKNLNNLLKKINLNDLGSVNDISSFNLGNDEDNDENESIKNELLILINKFQLLKNDNLTIYNKYNKRIIKIQKEIENNSDNLSQYVLELKKIVI